MSQTFSNTNQEWLKVLGKGMITIPKKWREELRIDEGAVVKAKKEGNKVVIEVQQTPVVPYRVYSDAEINKFLKEDRLPRQFAKKVKKHLSRLPSK